MPTFYRIVKSDPPAETDFLSDRERGRPQPSNPADLVLWDGLSMFDNEHAARSVARRYPIIGGFIAVVDIPPDGPFRHESTLRAGHHTVWGNAATLMTHVRSVVPA